MGSASSFKQTLSHVFTKAGYACLKLAGKLFTDPRATEKQRYLADEKHKNLRYVYPLNRDSVIFDVGGYEGQWASDIFARYGCTIHVFEPIPEFADKIKQRFQQNDRIHVHTCGLGASDTTMEIALQQDGSSVFRVETDKKERVQIKSLKTALEELKIEQVDLIKINIEGGEYDLLEHAINTGLIPKLQNIQIQFHDFTPDASDRMEKIHTKLAETHHPTYQYRFVWENWERNS